ncbi:hypothetical protein, partial [Acinetobacter nosocomialis]|uniref:hypothetical protein n=1 Tax=Acinetobacter nosocomialis TaxID=106654 RepID=UPI0024545FC3
QTTPYPLPIGLVGSEMCIRDSLTSNSSLKAINLISSNCFSTSFYLHHRRWMCIIDHPNPFARGISAFFS